MDCSCYNGETVCVIEYVLPVMYCEPFEDRQGFNVLCKLGKCQKKLPL